MGLFSSKKKTVVGTTVSRVIDDASLPDSVKTGVLKSIFSDDGGNIPEFVLEELIQCIGLRAERMFQYADRTYSYGLPSGNILSATKGREEVATILETLEGAPVTVDYCRFGPPNSLHIGWMRLIAGYGYSPETNSFPDMTVEKGTPVYLHDMVVVIPIGSVDSYRPGMLEQWGLAARAGVTPERNLPAALAATLLSSPIEADETAAEDYIRFEIAYEGVEEVILEGGVYEVFAVVHETFTFPLDGYALDEKDYFHVKYMVGGVTKYWMYESGSGVYPTLDTVFDDPPQVNGTFFPFAYFRYGGVSQTLDTNTTEYRTTKRLLKYISMDFDDVSAAIEENPNIANVEQAMLMMAVPANTESQIERRYIYEFFDTIRDSQTNKYYSDVAGVLAANANDDSTLNRSTIIIEDARFKMALSNSGIFKRRRTGSIGAVGHYGSGITTETIQVEIAVSGESYYTYMQEQTFKYHTYRYQVSTNIYDEISVVDLQMKYHILGDYSTTADELDDILMIPIDRSITSQYSIPDREELYARSLHYIFNSVQVINVKWYQQEWFRLFLIIVAIVITVVSNGAGIKAFAAALTAGGTAATVALIALATTMLKGILISIALKMFVKEVGGDFALLLSIVIAAYAAYDIYNAGSLAGAPWANQLLNVSVGLTKAVSANLQDLMKDLAREYESFNLFRTEATKALEAANKLLEHTSYLSPAVIFGESPDDFYNRTVHSGNIGTLGISAISSYVDIALTLPKLDETLGDPYG